MLCLRNLVPAPHLRPRFADAAASILFSATLTPMPFHRDLLGLPEDAVWLDVDSPFRPEQLRIHVASGISTRYRDRDGSLSAIADLIACQFAAAPGNYLAFFSSFEYLDKVAAALAQAHPTVPQWRQTRAMAADDRAAFLDRLTEDSRGIGFAVLGGAFSEGIDLPGRRLIGAFVATLGLPPTTPASETLRQRIDDLFGAGYEYTYLYPGIQKVVQAVGRVVRGTDDRGVVHLIDDRFHSARVRRLLPAWWRIEESGSGVKRIAAPPSEAAPTASSQPMQVRFFPVLLAS